MIMTCVIMAKVVMVYIAMAYIVMAYIVMAHIVMAFTAMANKVAARMVMTKVVMAPEIRRRHGRACLPQQQHCELRQDAEHLRRRAVHVREPIGRAFLFSASRSTPTEHADATASPLPARAAMSRERRVIAARKTGTYICPG